MQERFAELFCRQHQLPPQRYQEAMLRSCLSRRAGILRPLLTLLSRRYFAPDYELILRVGLLMSPDALSDEIDDFLRHPANRGFLRSVLRLRLSTRQLRRLFNQLMPSIAGQVRGGGADALSNAAGQAAQLRRITT